VGYFERGSVYLTEETVMIQAILIRFLSRKTT